MTLPSKVASKQASKILIERQMVLLRAWLPKKKKESDAIEADCKVI